MRSLLVLLAWSSAACSSHGPGATPSSPAAPAGTAPGVISNVAPAAKPTHEPVATLDRSGCYGWCPIYKLTVFRDGTVAYSGERFVTTTGEATWTITPAEVDAIDKLFADAHYETLRDKYTSYDVTDGPSTTTSHTHAGRTKTIEHYSGDHASPAELREVEDGLDRLVHIEQHIGTEAEREKLSGR